MERTIVYIRTSTAEQTPELQLRDIETFCKKPYELYKEQQSAWAENVARPEFQKIVSLIKKGKVEDLYIWDLDRAFRNRKRLQEFLVLCKTYGCRIHSYRQKWLEDINNIPEPFNEIVMDLLCQITGWMAEEESLKKSERVLLSVKRRKDGTYSYKGNRWGRKPLPKQTIDRVIELHKLGKSLRQISSLVNIYDKNNNSKKIGTTTVHSIIQKYLKENPK